MFVAHGGISRLDRQRVREEAFQIWLLPHVMDVQAHQIPVTQL